MSRSGWRANQHQQAYLLELSDALRPLADATQLQATASRVLGQRLGANRVAYFETQGADYVVERDYAHDVPPLTGRYPISSFGSKLLAALHAGKVVTTNDVQHDEMWSVAERAAYAAIHIGAFVGVPLIKGGRFVAGLTAQMAAARVWTDADIELITQTAERTWAAVERARAEAALRDSEQRYRTLFESVDEGFCIVEVLFDDAGRAVDYVFLEANPAFTKQTGLADAVGRRAREIVPQLEAHWFETYGRVATTGEAVRFENRSEPMGRWFDVYALRVQEPHLRRVAILFTDITERSEEALRQADRRKDEFLATLAHELRNPLAPIRNALHLLKLAGPAAQVERIHEMLERQVNHMVRLVDDLMEASRISRGQLGLKRQALDLKDVLRTAVETSKPLIDANRHSLTVTLPDAPLPMDGDAVRLAQLFANLLNNAAHYTDLAGHIELSATTTADEVEVVVRDDGVGIDAAQLPRLFEMFTQLDRHQPRGHGGLGIGLALVQRLAQMHGGSVQAASGGAGCGSTFTVRLPLTQRPIVVSLPPAPASALDARRILIVDDNKDAADSLGMLLRFLGAEARVEHDGAAAIATTLAWRPSIVLLYLGMPRMDGFDVARRLRAEPGLNGLKIVALSGWGQEADRQRTRTGGFDHHLIKPVDLNLLQTLLLSMHEA